MGTWFWLIIALFLGLIELFTGTVNFLLLGLSALVIALISWLFPSSALGFQSTLFAACAVISLSFLWFIRNRHSFHKRNENVLNEKAMMLIGQKFSINNSLHNYKGQLMIDGVLWRIKADENYIAGTVVKIKDIKGNILIVKAFEPFS